MPAERLRKRRKAEAVEATEIDRRKVGAVVVNPTPELRDRRQSPNPSVENRHFFQPGDQIMESHPGGRDTGRQILRYIASGAFGDVYEVHLTNETAKLHEAMKMVTITDSNTRQPLSDAARLRRLGPLVREARLMLKLGRHPNLVGIRAAYTIYSNFFIFMDLVPGGLTLRQVISESMGGLEVERAAAVAHEMARGLEFMHARGIVHWDVKPANVLVESAGDELGVVKLADFGTATMRRLGNQEAEGVEFRGCTAAYSSPETQALCGKRPMVLEAMLKQMIPSNDARLHSGATLEHVLRCGSTVDQESTRQLDVNPGTKTEAKLESMIPSRGAKSHLHGPTFESKERIVVDPRSITMRSSADVTTALVAAGSQDEWSWAVVLVEMLTGKIVGRGAADIPSSVDEGLRDRCFALARRCLDDDHCSRPSIESVCKVLKAALDAAGVQAIDELKSDELPMPELARLHQNIGHTFYRQLGSSQEDFALADEHLREFLRIVTGIYGRESSECATALNCLAESSKAQGKFENAKPLYEEALKTQQQALGNEHADVAATLHNLAGLLSAQGLHYDALEKCERALEIYRKALGANHTHTRTAQKLEAHIRSQM